ncbi:MAG: chemotaxis response regulator protein-glutamate methylesterase [Acetobacteraceae bacterium]|nr:chemotaxis response regulator protein-glutamate methylesterase [Acetobacteraceae bacterium]
MPVRVLILDDSATMRGLIASRLRRDPEIEIVGEAADPVEARQAIKTLNPDVLTLDIEMPKMNGLDFLDKIMRLRPMPVIMVSTLTQQGADATIEALAMGAFDCVAKPTPEMPDTFAGLPEKVKAAAQARIGGRGESGHGCLKQTGASAVFETNGKLVAIGSSTGGVEALLSVLSAYPPNGPATVITQHMPSTFTRSFADRLNRACASEVCEAFDGAPIAAGHVYLAPGGSTHLEITGSHPPRCRLRSGDAVNGHRPSVDVLFNSVAAHAKSNAVGVILTGMGSDGAKGLLAMRDAGARTLGQDQASSVVYGMPRAAQEINAVQRQLPLHRIAAQIIESTRQVTRGTR